MAKYVKLGDKAGVFHDISTKFTVCAGEIKELTTKAQASTKVKKALLNGHLVYAQMEELQEETKKELDINKLVKKFNKVYSKSPDKLISSFTFEELAQIANSMDIMVEDTDTPESVIEAITHELQEETKE